MWTNPLDRVPQIPQDWANHIVWGGGLGAVVAVLAFNAKYFGVDLSAPECFDIGTAVTFLVATAKKVVDYLKVGPPTEALEICIGKSFVTAIWPASLSLVVHGVL